MKSVKFAFVSIVLIMSTTQLKAEIIRRPFVCLQPMIMTSTASVSGFITFDSEKKKYPNSMVFEVVANLDIELFHVASDHGGGHDDGGHGGHNPAPLPSPTPPPPHGGHGDEPTFTLKSVQMVGSMDFALSADLKKSDAGVIYLSDPKYPPSLSEHIFGKPKPKVYQLNRDLASTTDEEPNGSIRFDTFSRKKPGTGLYSIYCELLPAGAN